MYIALSLIIGLVLGFVISKLKFDVQKAKLQSEVDALKNSQNTSQNLCETIKSEFVNLANAAILEKQQMLEEQNLKNLNVQLNPLKERILEFQKKVEEFNVSGVKNTNIIQEQIKSLTNENNLIRTQAENLTRALKENSKSRGLFGEMILENILKSSGMENKTENPERGTYITQNGFRSNNDPNGAKITPDAVVYYPDDDKNIVIDSKMSFVDFLNFVEADDENEKQNSLKQFYKSIEDRINELSGKYDNLEGLATPDFTLMFVPVEACINYIYSNVKLVEDAYKKRVVIVGPASFIATLRVIKYSWAQKNQEKNVREILKVSDNIYSKVATLIGHLEKLQTNFTTVQKTFGQIFTTLSGRGGLFSQTEKLKDYGIAPANSIDKKYIEASNDESLEAKL